MALGSQHVFEMRLRIDHLLRFVPSTLNSLESLTDGDAPGIKQMCQTKIPVDGETHDWAAGEPFLPETEIDGLLDSCRVVNRYPTTLGVQHRSEAHLEVGIVFLGNNFDDASNAVIYYWHHVCCCAADKTVCACFPFPESKDTSFQIRTIRAPATRPWHARRAFGGNRRLFEGLRPTAGQGRMPRQGRVPPGELCFCEAESKSAAWAFDVLFFRACCSRWVNIAQHRPK